jgi:glucuronokinase
MFIQSQAYARAGLLGNPSDGYFGRILAVSIKNFVARVRLEQSDELIIRTPELERTTFGSLQDLAEHVQLYGYYGGERLVKAGIKQFIQYCSGNRIPLEAKNFTLSFDSDIPRQLGLGGSSAIITAVFRALIQFYHTEIPQHILPTLILDAERRELGINAGFMDRVIQVYEGCVFMDLDQKHIETHGYGQYENLDPGLLPPLYLAFKPALGKVSGHVLNPIREGFDRGDHVVLDALHRLAELADEGRAALLRGEQRRLHALMDENFDLRSRIMPINPENLALIQAARQCGASAKFAGSGGSLIGMYADEDMFRDLVHELGKLQAVVIKPQIA